MIDLDALIERAQELDPLPQSSFRLTAILTSDDWCFEDLADVVRKDPPLAARILGMANSPAYGSRAPIVDIGQALGRVGPGTTFGLAVASGARSLLTNPLEVYGIGAGELWRHSVATALVVEELRSFLPDAASPEAYAAALLHDIGRLVLAHSLGVEDVQYLHRAETEGGLNITDAEMELLDVHHGEVGGLIARHWGLPESIVTGITYHHDPADAPTDEGRRLCDLLAIADTVATNLGSPDGAAHDPGPDFEPAARLGLDSDALAQLGAWVEERLDEVLEVFV